MWLAVLTTILSTSALTAAVTLALAPGRASLPPGRLHHEGWVSLLAGAAVILMLIAAILWLRFMIFAPTPETLRAD